MSASDCSGCPILRCVGVVPVGVDNAGGCTQGLHSSAALHVLVPAGRSLSALDQNLIAQAGVTPLLCMAAPPHA